MDDDGIPAAEPNRLTRTVEETALLLGISRGKAYECVRRGEIPSKRFGRRIVVPLSAIEELLEAGH